MVRRRRCEGSRRLGHYSAAKGRLYRQALTDDSAFVSGWLAPPGVGGHEMQALLVSLRCFLSGAILLAALQASPPNPPPGLCHGWKPACTPRASAASPPMRPGAGR